MCFAAATDALTKKVIKGASGSSNAEGAFDPICNYHDVCFETPTPGVDGTTAFKNCNSDLHKGLRQMCKFAFPQRKLLSSHPNPGTVANDVKDNAIAAKNLIKCNLAAEAVYDGPR